MKRHYLLFLGACYEQPKGKRYVDPDPLDPYYGRLAGSGYVWRDTDPDPGHINVQNNAMEKDFCVNKMINVDFFTKILNIFLKQLLLHNFF